MKTTKEERRRHAIKIRDSLPLSFASIYCCRINEDIELLEEQNKIMKEALEKIMHEEIYGCKTTSLNALNKIQKLENK